MISATTACVLQVQLVPGEAVREELGALVVLVRHSGLEGMQYFPPHGAHARPEAALLFELVTLVGCETHKQLAGGSASLFTVSDKRNKSQA